MYKRRTKAALFASRAVVRSVQSVGLTSVSLLQQLRVARVDGVDGSP